MPRGDGSTTARRRPDDSVEMVVGTTATRSDQDVAGGAATRDGPEPGGGVGRRVLVWTLVVLVVLIALAAARLAARPEAEPTPALARAPTEAVDLRWSLDLPAGSTPVVVVVPGPAVDDLLLRRVATDEAGATTDVMERRDGVTGAVEWSIPVGRGEVVIPIAGDQPLGGPAYGPDDDVATAGVRAIEVADGSTAWTRPDVDATTVTRLGADLVAVDDRACGGLEVASGAATFTLGATRGRCEPTPTALRWRDGGNWTWVDGSGRRLARVPTTAADTALAGRPVLVGDVAVRLGDSPGRSDDASEARPVAVTGAPTSGGTGWRVALDGGPWWRLDSLGEEHVAVEGAGGTVVLDVRTGRSTARFDSRVVPVPLGTPDAAGQVALLSARGWRSPLEAAGVWSRSPDATVVALADPDGSVRGTQSLVVTSELVVTADGVAVAHGPDDDRRVSLLSRDDLSSRWAVPTPLRFGQVVTTSRDLVVVVGDIDGRRRLDVLGTTPATSS